MSSAIKNIIFLFTFCFFYACTDKQSQQEIISFSGEVITLTGKIQEHQLYQDYLFVKVSVENLLKSSTNIQTKPILADGTFNLSFPIFNAKDFEFIYGGKKIQLFANPGDSLQLTFNAADFVAGNISSEKNKITGANPTFNEAILDFQNAHRNTFKPIAKTNYEPEAYKLQRLNHWQKEKNFIQKYFTKHSLNDKTKNWISNQIDYSAANDLLTYPNRFNLPPEQRKLPKNYLDFLQKIPLDNFTGLENSVYAKFLNSYANYQKEFQTKKIFNICDENFEEEFTSINKITSTTLKEIIKTQYIYQHLNAENFDCASPTINSLKTASLKTFLNKKEFIKNKPAIHFADAKSGKIEILADIIKQHQGKVIYIDFWATWCGPCIKEMPIYNSLRKKFDEQDVAFVYLAINSPEGLWKSTAKDLKLIGDNFLLNDQQYEELDRLIYIEAIPHHILINKAGELVGDKAPRPSNGEGLEVNKELVKEIYNLLLPI